MTFGGTMKRSVAALSVVLLAVLAGCGSDPKPVEPSGTISETVPQVPDEANETTPDGVAAFVQYFVGQINYAARTGDAKGVRQSATRCSDCSALADRLEAAARRGESADSDIWEIKSLQVSTAADSWLATSTIRSRTPNGPASTNVQFVLTKDAPFMIVSMYQLPK